MDTEITRKTTTLKYGKTGKSRESQLRYALLDGAEVAAAIN